MVRVLLVANKTLGSAEVSKFVRDRMAKDECQFTLLVPATPRWDRQIRRLASANVASPDENETTTTSPARGWSMGLDYLGVWAQTWTVISETPTRQKRSRMSCNEKSLMRSPCHSYRRVSPTGCGWIFLIRSSVSSTFR